MATGPKTGRVNRCPVCDAEISEGVDRTVRVASVLLQPKNGPARRRERAAAIRAQNASGGF